ncbi:hypothetical protein TruAng_011089 [Truncatella angustata]|nr:hypothetical protein TruAng_011089 [Truncatella angustata]
MVASLPKDVLRARYVGKSLYQVSTPAAVLDLAKVEANCNLMLEAAQRLNLSWRAHIKTHKTAELTRLQVGDQDTTPVNIVVSTLVEAENVLPLLKEYQIRGRQVNVLFGFPIFASCVDRLATISAQLGPDASKSGNPPLVFLKVNVASGRAGVVPGSPDCLRLVDQLIVSEAVGSCVFLGLYTHTSQSYEMRQDWEALNFLGLELSSLDIVAQAVRKERPNHPLVLSVGASPQVTSLQHPSFSDDDSSSLNLDGESLLAKISNLIGSLKKENFAVEVHAGVYTTLDLQQLAAHGRDSRFLSPAAIAISVLVEVGSLYPGRGPDGTTEALINAGTLALAREPCVDKGSPPGRDYSNWGIVAPWNCGSQPVPGPEFPAKHGGWQVGEVTQEHGILRWVGAKDDEVNLYVGQRLRIWPNHACITSASHGWYLIVDSRNHGQKDEIVDVWPRWNGW